MEIKTRVEGNRAIAEPVGNMDTNTSDEIQKLMLELIEQYPVTQLDMRSIPYVSSAGLRVVLCCQKQVAKCKKRFEISNPQPQADELFEMVNFKQFLTIV